MRGKFGGSISPIMKRIMSALKEDGDMSAEDLAEQLEVSTSYIRQYGIAPLRDAGMIRIASWIRCRRGDHTRVFSLSAGKDAPKPKRLPWSVTNRRWRERHAAGITLARNSLSLLVNITGRRA